MLFDIITDLTFSVFDELSNNYGESNTDITQTDDTYDSCSTLQCGLWFDDFFDI